MYTAAISSWLSVRKMKILTVHRIVSLCLALTVSLRTRGSGFPKPGGMQLRSIILGRDDKDLLRFLSIIVLQKIVLQSAWPSELFPKKQNIEAIAVAKA